MKYLPIIVGFIVFALGWAIRSTYVMHSYVNKPIGGALITIGFMVLAWGIFKLIKS